MAPKFREGDAVVAFSGKWVSWAHTVVAYSAFIGALVTGLSLHYKKIVENEYYVGGRPSLVVACNADPRRVIPRNGFLRSPQPLGTAIQSELSSSFSLQ